MSSSPEAINPGQLGSWGVSRSAAALHRQALVWDNHGCLPFDEMERWLGEIERYRQAGVDVVMLNIGDGDRPLESLMRVAATIRAYVGRHPERYTLALSVDAIAAARRDGKLAIGLDVEGAFALGSQLDIIQLFYDIGVRWMLLVYNRANLVGSGVHDDRDRGLTALGRAVVREMDRVGLVKCCTHTGYRTALDVMNMTDRPTIFSHSNPRALRDHARNVTDELIEACAATGGVVCLSGVGIFLGDNDATVETFVNHLDYVAQRVGIAHVGIGLDYVFDQEGLGRLLAANANIWPAGHGYKPGVKFVPPEALPQVTQEMLRRGYSESEVRAVLGENLLRVAREVWR